MAPIKRERERERMRSNDVEQSKHQKLLHAFFDGSSSSAASTLAPSSPREASTLQPMHGGNTI